MTESGKSWIDEHCAKIRAEVKENYKDLDAVKVGMIWIDLKEKFSELKSDIIDAESSAGDVYYKMKDIDKRVDDLEHQFWSIKYWCQDKAEHEEEERKYRQRKGVQ